MLRETPDGRGTSLARGSAPGLSSGGLIGLEEELLDIGDLQGAVWHRPPLAEVEAQHQDPETIRVFLNGCFDLMHVGHFNVLRQAKRSFYSRGFKRVVLVAGIHSDSAIAGAKRPPLMCHEERVELVTLVKWVDEVVTGLPYVSMSVEMADVLRVRYICHGDDMPTAKGGGGMYSAAIEADRFHLLKRTEGISTTHIIERLLRRSSGNAQPRVGQVLTTASRLAQFVEPSDPWRLQKHLKEAQRVVYVVGIFDLLHVGHARLLQRASEMGDFLLVGLLSSEHIHELRGISPILTTQERALALLSLRSVDDVILGAPWEVTQELLVSMNISVVVAGTRQDKPPERPDMHELPRSMGIFVEL
eukprot:CAMPEP_0170639874 /NCGR_PEP_ID=MMETSP0224-20130122/39895_1 /TAXON_ID=285029 /ORGANISM="Togula jolla, Strain CCCM 725" /LENGTH=359 /DNA_ID=CAMNT_0010970285 /DNA_START=39 /DNA_END=1115 /DNA_ORIENTATION=+